MTPNIVSFCDITESKIYQWKYVIMQIYRNYNNANILMEQWDHYEVVSLLTVASNNGRRESYKEKARTNIFLSYKKP